MNCIIKIYRQKAWDGGVAIWLFCLSMWLFFYPVCRMYVDQYKFNDIVKLLKKKLLLNHATTKVAMCPSDWKVPGVLNSLIWKAAYATVSGQAFSPLFTSDRLISQRLIPT